MIELAFTVMVAAMNILLPYAITYVDRRRLDREQLERAWNGPSWACAVYFFGPLCLPAHFWVTRRRVTALFIGASWAAAVLGIEYLIGSAIEAIFEKA